MVTTDWEGAACIGYPPEFWFPKDYQRKERDLALLLCNGDARNPVCPIRQACLDAAMAIEAEVGYNNRQGIFGGLTPLERRRLGTKPKVRAPEQHGTPAGYRAHGRASTQACRPCMDAMSAARRVERQRRAAA